MQLKTPAADQCCFVALTEDVKIREGEIALVKGRVADALSRSVKAENKQLLDDASVETDDLEGRLPLVVGTVVILPQWSLADVRQMQLQDPVIGEVLKYMPGNRPAATGNWLSDRKLNTCRQVWESFVKEGGVMYRKL